MANPLKKNTRNDKRSKPLNAARPETAKTGAQSAAISPVAAQPPQTEEPNRLPSQEEVEKRAYQIFQARGGEHGRHLEDWEQAEQELKLGMQ